MTNFTSLPHSREAQLDEGCVVVYFLSVNTPLSSVISDKVLLTIFGNVVCDPSLTVPRDLAQTPTNTIPPPPREGITFF